MTRNHRLAEGIVVGDSADLAPRSLFGGLQRFLELDAEQGGHGALAYRHRRLHRLAAQLEQLCGRRQINRSCRAQRAIFAQAVSRDIGKADRHIARLPLERAEHRDRVGHDRGLRVLGQLQLVCRTFGHQLEQVLAERLVDLFEHRARLGARFGQGLAHADLLTALSRKNECACHDYRRPSPHKIAPAPSSPCVKRRPLILLPHSCKAVGGKQLAAI